VSESDLHPEQYLEDNEKLIHAVMENMAAGRLESVAK
jgi:hypothetical protein